MPGGAVPIGGGGGNPFKTGFVRREYIPAFCLVTSLFFLWGFCYGLIDVLNKHFKNVLHITRTQSTCLQVAYFGGGYLLFSPVAAEVLRRRGYKFAIVMGLFLYSTGAILFWPVAKFSVGTTNPMGVFAGFVVCTFVTACGLATLEVTANSYVTTIPPAETKAFRLNFSQSFNGVASFTGPLIASKYFFAGDNADNLTNVQFVYMAVAGMGLVVAALFFIIKLPEVSEEALQAEADALADGEGAESTSHLSFWRQTRALTGFVAQFLYVGAQVTIGTFFLFYAHENAGIADEQGAQLLSYGLITFTVARFIGTALLSVINAPVLLCAYACCATVLGIVIASSHGMGGVICMILIMFFESIMYPVIFVLGTSGLGRHTRRASGLLVQGVAGGAVLPLIQGAISDRYSTRVSFFVVVPCFIYIALWAVYIWNKDGRKWTVTRAEKEVEREIEAAAGSTYPAAHIGGLNYQGDRGNYEGSIKEDLERVEKA